MGQLVAKVNPFADALQAIAAHQQLTTRLRREKQVNAYNVLTNAYSNNLTAAAAQTSLNPQYQNLALNPTNILGGAF